MKLIVLRFRTHPLRRLQHFNFGTCPKNLHEWLIFWHMPLANDPSTHEIELRQYVMLKHVPGLYHASHFFGVQVPCGTTTHADNTEVNRKDVWIVVDALVNLLLCGVDMPDFWRPPPSWLQVRHMRRRYINAIHTGMFLPTNDDIATWKWWKASHNQRMFQNHRLSVHGANYFVYQTENA